MAPKFPAPVVSFTYFYNSLLWASFFAYSHPSLSWKMRYIPLTKCRIRPLPNPPPPPATPHIKKWSKQSQAQPPGGPF
jgi:hypothetical protein